MSKLFSSFKVESIELKNRIVMAPMCMYSAEDDGKAKDWHFIHYTSRSIGGVGLIIRKPQL
jgi:NADPH2 dehydrogenase